MSAETAGIVGSVILSLIERGFLKPSPELSMAAREIAREVDKSLGAVKTAEK